MIPRGWRSIAAVVIAAVMLLLAFTASTLPAHSDVATVPRTSFVKVVHQSRAHRVEAARWRAMAHGPFTIEGNRAIGHALASAIYGWRGAELDALDALWGDGESGWNHLAVNPTSGALGIPQSLPGSKMGSVGADYRENPATQIVWGLRYIAGRYGSPSRALAAWRARSPHWY